MLALKLAQSAGMKVVLTSSSDDKLGEISQQFASPSLVTVNYARNPERHAEVLKLTDGVGVVLVVEVGGSSSLVKSMKCTRRGGTVSVVGYLSKQDPGQMAELLPVCWPLHCNLGGFIINFISRVVGGP